MAESTDEIGTQSSISGGSRPAAASKDLRRILRRSNRCRVEMTFDVVVEEFARIGPLLACLPDMVSALLDELLVAQAGHGVRVEARWLYERELDDEGGERS